MSRTDAARMRAAATVVTACREAFAEQPGGVFAVLGGGDRALFDWRHYPQGEVYDPQSHAQYFFHAHPALQPPLRERGHFHMFLRAEGMPAGTLPLVLPETALADAPSPPQAAPLKHGGRDEVSHLVAIALDARGEPIRLFTTNRWVTGETWYRAEDVIGMLDRFTLATAAGPALVNRWLAALLALFRPQAAAALRQRDEAVMNWRWRRRTNVLEDSRLEIPSSFEIDLDLQLGFLAALKFDDEPDVARAARLPPMAEGWDESRID